MNTSVKPEWWLCLLQPSEYFPVIYHCFQQILVKKKKKISSDILNVGGEEKTAWRGKHVRALWLNAALLAPNHLKKKKKKKKSTC